MSTEAMRASMILVDGVPIREHEERESLKQFEPEVDMALDVGIRDAVCILRRAGVETYESCDGSGGHSFKEPTIRFYGGVPAAHRAFAAATESGLIVATLRPVVYQVENGALTGPFGEITFRLLPEFVATPPRSDPGE